jgi:hypothetical protein
MDCGNGREAVYSIASQNCWCKTSKASSSEVQGQPPLIQQRQAKDPVPQFIPPPKTDITPELIDQALTAQPQNDALISSAIPYFLDGVVRVSLQLTGPVPYTLVVNCSTSFPCGGIGRPDPQPDLAMVPLVMNTGQGSPQTVVANCELIGINIYKQPILNYWVQDLDDGTVFSVVGNNIVVDIDKMNTTQSTALTLTTQTSLKQKRTTDNNLEYAYLDKRQMWGVKCTAACPFNFMTKLRGTDGHCGCIFEGSAEINKRDFMQPDNMNAKMTESSCAAMTCLTGGSPRPALYNPFHQTCWCISAPNIESNPNAWTPTS